MRAALLAMFGACWSGSSAKPAEPPAIENKRAADSPPPLPPAEETAMMALERFTNEMCQCSDFECATAVSNDLTTWAQVYSREHPESQEMSEADKGRATELATRMGECMVKAMATASGSGSGTGSSAP